MQNAAALIQSRNAKKTASRYSKPSATLPSVIRQPQARAFNMAPPPGGFCTATLRQQNIIREIQIKPNLTPREYADRLLVLAKDVHDTLLFSREGRQLAELGMVCISDKGAIPRWAKLCENKQRIFTRRRQPQIMAVELPGVIRGQNRVALTEAISTMQDIIISTTNRRMKTLLDQAVAALIKSGKAYAATEVQNKLLTSNAA